MILQLGNYADQPCSVTLVAPEQKWLRSMSFAQLQIGRKVVGDYSSAADTAMPGFDHSRV